VEKVGYDIRFNRLEKSIDVENMFISTCDNDVGIVLAHGYDDLLPKRPFGSHI